MMTSMVNDYDKEKSQWPAKTPVLLRRLTPRRRRKARDIPATRHGKSRRNGIYA